MGFDLFANGLEKAGQTIAFDEESGFGYGVIWGVVLILGLILRGFSSFF